MHLHGNEVGTDGEQNLPEAQQESKEQDDAMNTQPHFPGTCPKPIMPPAATVSTKALADELAYVLWFNEEKRKCAPDRPFRDHRGTYAQPIK